MNYLCGNCQSPLRVDIIIESNGVVLGYNLLLECHVCKHVNKFTSRHLFIDESVFEEEEDVKKPKKKEELEVKGRDYWG